MAPFTGRDAHGFDTSYSCGLADTCTGCAEYRASDTLKFAAWLAGTYTAYTPLYLPLTG